MPLARATKTVTIYKLRSWIQARTRAEVTSRLTTMKTWDGNYLYNPNANLTDGQTTINIFWGFNQQMHLQREASLNKCSTRTQWTHTSITPTHTHAHIPTHTQLQWRSNEIEFSYEHCLSLAFLNSVSKFTAPDNALTIRVGSKSQERVLLMVTVFVVWIHGNINKNSNRLSSVFIATGEF